MHYLTGAWDFFKINTLGTSFRECILFEWDYKKKYNQTNFPTILPTENEEMVSRMIHFYLLKILDIYRDLNEWKVFNDLNTLLVNKQNRNLPDVVNKAVHVLKMIEDSDKGKYLYDDTKLIREGLDIYENSLILKNYNGDYFRKQSPYHGEEYYDSSVKIALAVGLVSTILYLIHQLNELVKGKKASGVNLREYRGSPIYMHLKTMVDLNKRSSLERISDYANIRTDYEANNKIGNDKTFIVFMKMKGLYGAYNTDKIDKLKVEPEDIANKQDAGILKSILGQETQVVYIGFITVFYYVYVAHFMMRYIKERWNDVSKMDSVGNWNSLPNQSTKSDIGGNVPESFEHYFGLEGINVKTEMEHQQKLTSDEKERARKMLSLVQSRPTGDN